MQERIVRTQVEVISAAARVCIHCGRNKAVKDLRSRRLRTVFGTVDVFCRRYVWCTCCGGKPRIEWPLRDIGLRRSTPELSYVLAKWGSTMPYRRTAQLPSEFLPLQDGGVSHTTVRRHTLAVGQKLDQRATEPAEYDWPESPRQTVPATRHVTVAIDDTYIRANTNAWGRQHYVVAGRIEREGQLSGHFAWVAQRFQRSVPYMKAALDDTGCTAESTIAVLADGADGLNSVVQAASSQQPRNILDWFHISMRLRPIEQMGQKLAHELADQNGSMATVIEQLLPRVRYQMWHGKFAAAVNRMREIFKATTDVCGALTPAETERVNRFRKHLIDLRDYLKNNWSSLTNYAHAKRYGLRISSAPAESGMSHLVNQRMGKRQPMCWSSDGAHLLLQVRCAVLDDRLETLFREQHPRFRTMPAAVKLPVV